MAEGVATLVVFGVCEVVCVVMDGVAQSTREVLRRHTDPRRRIFFIEEK